MLYVSYHMFFEFVFLFFLYDTKIIAMKNAYDDVFFFSSPPGERHSQSLNGCKESGSALAFICADELSFA